MFRSQALCGSVRPTPFRTRQVLMLLLESFSRCWSLPRWDLWLIPAATNPSLCRSFASVFGTNADSWPCPDPMLKSLLQRLLELAPRFSRDWWAHSHGRCHLASWWATSETQIPLPIFTLDPSFLLHKLLMIALYFSTCGPLLPESIWSSFGRTCLQSFALTSTNSTPPLVVRGSCWTLNVSNQTAPRQPFNPVPCR